MASDPRFGTNPNQYDQTTFQIEEPPQKRNPWKTCVIGCLGVLGFLLLLAVVAGFWVSRHFRGWVADVGSQAVNQMVDSSDLPAQEKVEVKEQVERVTNAFGDGRISIEQSGAIFEKLMKSPLMPSVVVMAVDKKYFDKSKLSDEEKTQARQVLKRFARGVFDDKIKDDGFDSVMKHIAEQRDNHQWHLKTQVSDDELRAAINDAKAQADKAGIPEAPENIDPSDEIKLIIDESLTEDRREDAK